MSKHPPAPLCSRPAACQAVLDKLAYETGLRADKIERARQLLANPNYPPGEIIQALAEMLAQKQRLWGFPPTG